MKVLVAHASRYGATQAIAERIAEKLTEAGDEAQARPVKAVADEREWADQFSKPGPEGVGTID